MNVGTSVIGSAKAAIGKTVRITDSASLVAFIAYSLFTSQLIKDTMTGKGEITIFNLILIKKIKSKPYP